MNFISARKIEIIEIKILDTRMRIGLEIYSSTVGIKYETPLSCIWIAGDPFTSDIV